jgi:toxin ParE1/3/4
MAKFFLTKKAVADLSDIWDYTYETWSERQADKYYELLMAACRDISERPEKGKQYVEIAKEILGFRIGKHILFYRIINPYEIEVVRILHEKMDLKNQIKEK